MLLTELQVLGSLDRFRTLIVAGALVCGGMGRCLQSYEGNLIFVLKAWVVIFLSHILCGAKYLLYYTYNIMTLILKLKTLINYIVIKHPFHLVFCLPTILASIL